MTTSGSYVFDPSFSAILDESAERAGMDPATLSSRHIQSAKMSLNLLLTHWAAEDGDAAFRIDRLSATVLSGVSYFDPSSGVFDLVDVVIAYNGATTDAPMNRIGQQDYLNIADKTASGQPTLFYVDQGTPNAPRVYLWPVPDADCVFTYDAMRHSQTVQSLANTLDTGRLWMDAICAGVALRLAEKYNTARVPMLMSQASTSYASARKGSKGRVGIRVAGRGFGSSMRGRRG